MSAPRRPGLTQEQRDDIDLALLDVYRAMDFDIGTTTAILLRAAYLQGREDQRNGRPIAGVAQQPSTTTSGRSR